MLKKLALIALSVGLLSSAFGEESLSTEREVVQTQMVSEEASIQPGRPFWIGIVLTTDEQWHIYWKNPGSAGAPTEVLWDLPDGFTIGSVKWPIPDMYSEGGLVSVGYSGPAVLLAQILPPKDLAFGSDVSLKARVQWVACHDSCVPGEKMLELSLPVTEQMPAAAEERIQFFNKARESLPQVFNELVGELSPGNTELKIPLTQQQCSASQVYFLPEADGVVDWESPQIVKKTENECALTLQLTDQWAKSKEPINGVLVSKDKISSLGSQVHVTLMPPPENAQGAGSMLWIFLGAFAGGLLLNLMPCVLPVLSLKVLSIVQTGNGERRDKFRKTAAYSLGVLLSYLALASLLLLMRHFGHQVGWGFQLQEPLFVAFLAGLFFLIALNFYGVFELGTSLTRLEGKRSPSAFFSGMLAVLVATPCTGPFLGTALGVAATLTPIYSLAVFTCMALGMIAPFALLACVPGASRFLPKPGPWMLTFKQIMGFFLLATVLWLLWVYGAQCGLSALFQILIALFVLSFGAWTLGHFGTLAKKPLTRRLSQVICLGALLGAGSIAYQASTPQMIDRPLADTWEEFSLERLDACRREGKPVLIDFTAKWCLTCQANHRILERPEIAKALVEKSVVKMRADWTSRNPQITQALARFGRSAVPLYVLYGKEGDAPILLPQILTSSLVMEYLEGV